VEECLTLYYGDNCLRLRKVYKLMKRFKGRRMIAFVNEQSGRPFTITCVDDTEQIYQRIRDNPGINSDKI
jgi:hypothetical protein